ncbi:MAG: hypothetical protein KDE04_11910, partial [Anaerolineales bacterium]|nr:hypothetical protein [Anaerolineales bacterium]
MIREIITPQTDLGGLCYPFLPAEWGWQILVHELNQQAIYAHDQEFGEPTMRIVKDGSVIDIHVPGMNLAEFSLFSGIHVREASFKACKRLSRAIARREYAAFFYDEDEVAIRYDASLDPVVWDGAGRMSLAFLKRHVARLRESAQISSRTAARLLRTRRFEITIMTAAGQEKGHVVVAEQMTDTDFLFPAGSTKPEVTLENGQVYVALQSVKANAAMRLDIQSLINLYPFFKPEMLWAWAEAEGEFFLDSIRTGRVHQLFERISGVHSADDLESVRDWYLTDFVASGGDLRWFAHTIRAAGRQHLKRIGSNQEKLRFPCPGARYYILPAGVGGGTIGAGEVLLDKAYATAWVNDEDWTDWLAGVLGGADGDDAVWVFPFRDYDKSDKYLVWRSPNQVGEYAVLRPAAGSDPAGVTTGTGLAGEAAGGVRSFVARMDSRLLPPRIDTQSIQYGTLPAAARTEQAAYSIPALWPTIGQVEANLGLLGGYCNALMLIKALCQTVPSRLPASLEQVIDATVRDGRDLAPVRDWITRVAGYIARTVDAVPACIAERLLVSLSGAEQRQITVSQPIWDEATGRFLPGSADCPDKAHWLDKLTALMETHRLNYLTHLETLAAEAQPPLALFAAGQEMMLLGSQLRQCWNFSLATSRQEAVDDEAFALARTAVEAQLADLGSELRAPALLGAAAHVYSVGLTPGQAAGDACLWQTGDIDPVSGRRLASTAVWFLDALRQAGILAEPVWDEGSPLLKWHPGATVPVMAVALNGVWFNYRRAWAACKGQPMPATMGEIPAGVRRQVKAQVASLARSQWLGKLLTFQKGDDERLAALTEAGQLFGFVPRELEQRLVPGYPYRLLWSEA